MDEKNNELKRGLKVCYLNMIVLGGFIGIGIFVVMGDILN